MLADRLEPFAKRDDVVVLALPRGGVPVGYEVARALGAPLDVFVVRKLGLPGHPDFAMARSPVAMSGCSTTRCSHQSASRKTRSMLLPAANISSWRAASAPIATACRLSRLKADRDSGRRRVGDWLDDARSSTDGSSTPSRPNRRGRASWRLADLPGAAPICRRSRMRVNP